MDRHWRADRKTGGSYNSPPRRACRRWRRPTATIVRWSAKPVSRNTRRARVRKEEEPTRKRLRSIPAYDYKKETYAWGMAIDLNACVGCNNCIVACQSENNIAVVGKEQTARAGTCTGSASTLTTKAIATIPKPFSSPSVHAVRERSLRTRLPGRRDRSQQRRPERHGLQPLRRHALLLQQLSVQGSPLQFPALPGLGYAAVQDDAQSRRQCAQPRRHGEVHLLRAAHHEHRIDAETASIREDKEIRIGDELQTACQQSCPADAIVFGNINDPNSSVSKWKAQARNYSLLADLNTRPRTTYLAEIRNPNPELEA